MFHVLSRTGQQREKVTEILKEKNKCRYFLGNLYNLCGVPKTDIKTQPNTHLFFSNFKITRLMEF